MISLAEAVSNITLARAEEKALARLEVGVDAALFNFDGGPMRMEFKQAVTPRVAHALARQYESQGNWRVNVQLTKDACTFLFAPVFYTPPPQSAKAAPVVEKDVRPLPVLYKPNIGAQQTNSRLLVRMPTRGRPVQALEVLQKYRDMAGCEIQIEVVINYDDATMSTPEVLQRLWALGCTITVGDYNTKIEAVNSGQLRDWDVLLLASDDMVPVVDDYALRVLGEMEKHWPFLNGALYFDDGFQGRALCTLPVIGRRFHEEFFCNVYEPEYRSLFSDLEQSELWTQMGRLVYCDMKLIEHQHHVWGKAAFDDTYKRNDALEAVDKATYEHRKKLARPASQFAFDSPPLWLSILICTVPARKAQLKQLVDHLYAQIIPVYSRQVEILIDDGEGTIGEKRQRLLVRSKAHYTAFVDDDDMVAVDYVERVVNALISEPHVDCTSLQGILTTDGKFPERFEHSLIHDKWETRDGFHIRSPNHLNAVRRELALQAGFTSVNHGEDHAYSVALKPLLKVEASTGDKPLYFYFYKSNK